MSRERERVKRNPSGKTRRHVRWLWLVDWGVEEWEWERERECKVFDDEPTRAKVGPARIWHGEGCEKWLIEECESFFLSFYLLCQRERNSPAKKKELMKRNFLGFWDAAAGSSNISQQGIEEIDTSIHASRRHPFLLLPLFREQESMKHTTSSLLHFFFIFSALASDVRASESVCLIELLLTHPHDNHDRLKIWHY